MDLLIIACLIVAFICFIIWIFNDDDDIDLFGSGQESDDYLCCIAAIICSGA